MHQLTTQINKTIFLYNFATWLIIIFGRGYFQDNIYIIGCKNTEEKKVKNLGLTIH